MLDADSLTREQSRAIIAKSGRDTAEDDESGDTAEDDESGQTAEDDDESDDFWAAALMASTVCFQRGRSFALAQLLTLSGCGDLLELPVTATWNAEQFVAFQVCFSLGRPQGQSNVFACFAPVVAIALEGPQRTSPRLARSRNSLPTVESVIVT